MAKLRDIQLTELEMLRILDRMSRDNNLKYSLIGGTLLGAVRHKGFIPWDDDIDVYMPLEDIKKLKQIFNKEGYTLQTPETDIQMPFIMYKIRKDGTKMIEPGTEGLNMHHGVWLDIFPYVNAGKSKLAIRTQIFLRSLLQTYRCRYRYCKGESIRFFHKLFAEMPKDRQLKIDNFLQEMIEKLGSDKSDFYFAMDPGPYTIHRKSYFDNLDLFKFENGKYYGVMEYDAYLSSIYGKDYMTPRQWNHMGDYSQVVL